VLRVAVIQYFFDDAAMLHVLPVLWMTLKAVYHYCDSVSAASCTG